MSEEQKAAFAELLLAAQYAIDYYPGEAAPGYMDGIRTAVSDLAALGIQVVEKDDFPTVVFPPSTL